MQIKIWGAFFRLLCVSSLFVVLGARPVLSAGDPCRNIGVSGECEMFQDIIQVQPMVAQQLIRTALNDNNVTFGEYTNKTIGDDTYEITDSKGAKHIFWFDDLQDSKSASVEYSVAAAICLLNGGKIERNSNICYGRLSESKLNGQLSEFGMTVQCFDNMNSQPYCKIQAKTLSGKLRGFIFNNQTIIEPDVFQSMQIVSTDEVQNYLRDYTMLKLATNGLIMRSFRCLSMPISYKNINTLSDIIDDQDDVLSCTVSYFDPTADKTYKQTVDFLFDDMYEHGKNAASAGRAGLVCNAQGGSATTKGVCAGFTQEMCDAIRINYNIDTRWDTDAGGCIMLSMETDAQNKKITGIVEAVGGVAIGILLLPATGGTSVVGVVAVIGGIVTIVATYISQSAASEIDAMFTASLLDANKCMINQCGGVTTQNGQMVVKNKTSSDCIACATSSVENLIKSVIEFKGEYGNNDANASAYLIDALYSVVSGTMQPICIEAVAQGVKQNDYVTIKRAADTAILIGTLISLGSGIAGKVTKPNITTIFDKMGEGLQKLNKSKINVIAFETLAASSRMEKLALRIKNASMVISETVVGRLKNMTGLKNSSPFVERIGSVLDIKDGNDAANSIYNNWTATCNTDFPCTSTIDEFTISESLEMLCGG
jgi:hypothetical protein